ncbi:MAG: HAMP domain-containing sensor histidine kinase [Crocinitomicaceae bacterium]|nr:HAMP domain-containing sensor histidine kinase [Crocinitomicaceae bacterium]
MSQEFKRTSNFLEETCGICNEDCGYNNLGQKYYHEVHKKCEDTLKYELLSTLLNCLDHSNDLDSSQIFRVINVLGVVYSEFGIESQSLTKFTEASRGLYKFDDEKLLGLKVKIKVDIYSTYLDRSENIDFAHKSLIEMESEVNDLNDPIYLYSLYNSLGISFQLINDFDDLKSEHYLLKGLEQAQLLNDSSRICTSYTNLGSLNFDQYKSEETAYYWKMALGIAERNELLDVVSPIYFNMSLMYEEDGFPQKALAYQKLYAESLEQLWNRDKVWELAEQEKAFEIDKRETELALMQRDQEVQQLELENKTYQRNAMIGTSSFIAILGYIFYQLFRSKKKSNNLITLKNAQLKMLVQTKDRLFSIIGHDLRSPILSLKHRSDKIVASLTRAEHPVEYELAIANKQALQQMQGLIQNILDWGESQQGDNELFVQEVHLDRLVEQVVYDYRELIGQKSLSLSIEIAPSLLASVDVHCAKAVLRNALDNAIKFNDPQGFIHIYGTNDNGNPTICIDNDGVPVSVDIVEQFEKKIKTRTSSSGGLGLWICRDMMEQINGNFSIRRILLCEQSGKEGTRVQLTFN